MTTNKNNIHNVQFKSPEDMMHYLAQKAKVLRLEANLTQSGLAVRSGVSLGSVKRFEKTGEISLKSLLNIGMALRRLEDFDNVFSPSDVPQSLFTEEKKIPRQRGRRK